MFEKDLEIAKITLALIKCCLSDRMEAGRINPEELPLYGKIVEKCKNEVEYYEKLVAKSKKEN